MYKLRQIGNGYNQMCYFKSINDSRRYFKYFIENKEINFSKHLYPTLIAQTGYSENFIKQLDFINCVLPIPIFSQRFVETIGNKIEDELQFYPCSILVRNKKIDFYIGKIIKYKEIIDLKHSGRRQLTDGTFIPDIPYFYKRQKEDYYIIRDSTYKSHYIVSDFFKQLCMNLKMSFLEVNK